MPVIEETVKKVSVAFEEPSSTGLMKINFSVPITVPSNVTLWTWQNEGQEFIDIKYLPHEKSEMLFEDLEILMEFSWNIHEVKEVFGHKHYERRLDETIEE